MTLSKTDCAISLVALADGRAAGGEGAGGAGGDLSTK